MTVQRTISQRDLEKLVSTISKNVYGMANGDLEKGALPNDIETRILGYITETMAKNKEHYVAESSGFNSLEAYLTHETPQIVSSVSAIRQAAMPTIRTRLANALSGATAGGILSGAFIGTPYAAFIAGAENVVKAGAFIGIWGMAGAAAGAVWGYKWKSYQDYSRNVAQKIKSAQQQTQEKAYLAFESASHKAQ